MPVLNYQSLRMVLVAALKDAIQEENQRDEVYGQLADYLLAVIYDKIEQDSGIFERTEGGWYEWLMRGTVRTLEVGKEEVGRFEEELAVVFMQGDLDGDTTKRLLNSLGLHRGE